MTAIRPQPFPPTPPAAGAARADQAKLEAQRAFFQAALGKASAPVSPAVTTAATATPTPAPATLSRIPDAGAEKPQKILRPGSLLDIRV
jgi:hypothetical protein